MATTSFSNWDFYNFHVQQELVGGQFVSAESTLVAAGPPLVSQTQTPAFYTVDKKALAKALKLGEVEGAHLEDGKTSISIKSDCANLRCHRK